RSARRLRRASAVSPPKSRSPAALPAPRTAARLRWAHWRRTGSRVVLALPTITATPMLMAPLQRIALDPAAGLVELVEYHVVEDVGRIVNPLTLHGQVVGATVQGLGGAFMEELVYDASGQLLTGSLAEYLIPSATDFPRIRAISLQHRPSPTNPLGVKGA